MVSSLVFLSPLLLPIIIISATDQLATHTLPMAAAELHRLNHSCSNDKGNYTTNDSYHTNLYHLLSSLPSKHKGYGYYSSSYGRNTTSGEIYATALCRGDVETSQCLHCLTAARSTLMKLCPNQKEAIVWYRRCMLHYSNSYMYGVMETQPSFHMCSKRHVPSQFDMFFHNLTVLVERLRVEAEAGGSLKFAKNNTTILSYRNEGRASLRALVQCTPDLSEFQCRTCLLGAFNELLKCCDRKEGGRVLRPSCNFNYWLNVTEGVIEDPKGANVHKGVHKGHPVPGARDGRISIHFIVFATAVSVVLMISIGIYAKVAKRRPLPISAMQHNFLEEMDEHMAMESLLLDCAAIQVATNNFSEANKLGDDDEYGSVYRGNLSDAKPIAVRRLSRNYVKEYMEIKKEVLLMAKLQHPNLVALLGCAFEDNSERLLVYEDFPNATLDRIIFDGIKGRQLDWEMRYNIIVSIARGLLHLHDSHFAHGDVNASNTLIDAQMNPKISNFGMARFFVVDQAQGNINGIHLLDLISNSYMASEANVGHSSAESDVYCYGVLVLEIVSGLEISSLQSVKLNEKDLLSFAWKNWAKGTVKNLIDPTLWTGSGSELMERCIRIGLFCMRRTRTDVRPTMSSVIQMFSRHSSAIPRPYNFRHGSFGISGIMENEEGVSDPRSRARVQSLFAKMRCAIINRIRSK